MKTLPTGEYLYSIQIMDTVTHTYLIQAKTIEKARAIAENSMNTGTRDGIQSRTSRYGTYTTTL